MGRCGAASRNIAGQGRGLLLPPPWAPPRPAQPVLARHPNQVTCRRVPPLSIGWCAARPGRPHCHFFLLRAAPAAAGDDGEGRRYCGGCGPRAPGRDGGAHHERAGRRGVTPGRARLGDWGRKGTYNQSRVAEQMGRVGEELNIDFVISTGDNFYEDGLTGVDDPAFEQSFTDIYTAKSLQKPWYLVLGNHDYRGDVPAQLSPVLRKVDSRFICMKSFIVSAEIVDFFFIDTTPFQMKYWTHPKDHIYDWRGVAPREKYIDALLKDLDEAMEKSTAKWKIAVGHHTMRTVSHHGDTVELLQLLLPILKANGIDFYINGHDHCLEHISSRDSPIQYFTSGGGSKAWRGFFQPNEDKLKFFYDGQGFMSLQLYQDRADFIFYDVDGNILYQYSQWSLRKTYLLQHQSYLTEE